VEASIEVLGRSHAYFNSCTFTNSNKAAVIHRDGAIGTFQHCRFETPQQTAIILMNHSSAIIKECDFESATKFAIYIYQQSSMQMKSCHFGKTVGKAVFAGNGSVVSVSECNFEGCNKGGLTIYSQSTARLTKCTFSRMVGNCVHCVKGSELQLAECSFDNVDGNGVNFEFSHGCVTQSTFTGFTFPAIIVSGITSNPVISDCRVSGCKTFGIAARDASTPVFHNLTLERISGNGFSISQHSRAFVVNCHFSQIGGTFVSAFDGANPTIIGQLHSHPTMTIGESIVTEYAKSSQQPQINPETPMTFDDLKALPNEDHGEQYCAICHDCKATHALSPCGHVVMCEHCPTPTQCPICNTVVMTKVRIVCETVCVVCGDASADTVILPCGHKCVCYADAMRIAMSDKVCPICWERASLIRRQFRLPKTTETKMRV
jgi:uncharacterized protein YjbI with pentapeptide repeats